MLRTREETMKFVEMEIQRIKADWHIEDLMEHKCVDEVSQLICDESHFLVGTPLSEYTKIDKLLLRDEEIREKTIGDYACSSCGDNSSIPNAGHGSRRKRQ